ncbi:MAG: DUF1492 domain-containing protein [Anaerolineae bacterium]|nr:DUF1492 domain-containing protein [Anaerolineae bacterium]
MASDQDRQQVTVLLEQALKQWHREAEPLALDEALPFLARQAKANWSGNSSRPTQQVVNQLLLNLLETLAEQDAGAATLLRRRYIDDKTGFAVANSLGISESAFYRQRRDALAALTALALNLEAQTRSDHVSRLEDRLETPSYQQLFGLDGLRSRLGQLLCNSSNIRLFCLTGIGGIGKTSLADAVTRDLIAAGCFDEVLWISTRQHQFTPWAEIQMGDAPSLTPDEFVVALDRQLHKTMSPPRPPEEILSTLKIQMAKQAHLIVLDNLETAADYQELMPVLRDLAQFAWVLLTSRVDMYEQPDIHITNLAELNAVDAETLVRSEATRRGIHDLAQAPSEMMTQIYEVVGGNPLALKLIIGQVHVRSLSTVLSDLNEARGRRVEALYEFIYRRAWDLLDDVARQVLLTMPLVAAPGTTIEHIIGASGLTYDEVDSGLDLLIRLSLVNVGGSLNNRHFYIHRLTETFLHKQVTKWQT